MILYKRKIPSNNNNDDIKKRNVKRRIYYELS